MSDEGACVGSLQQGTLVSDLMKGLVHWKLISTLSCEGEEFLGHASHNYTPVVIPVRNEIHGFSKNFRDC